MAPRRDAPLLLLLALCSCARRAREDIHVRRGRILFAIGKYTQAVQELRAVVRRSPRDAEAHFWLGCACRASARLEEGIRHLERARALRPGDEPTSREFGSAYLDLEAGEQPPRAHDLRLKRLDKIRREATARKQGAHSP